MVWRWGTEATLVDTYRNLDLLPIARASGMQAVWFGIEDLTARLVNKGQTADKTRVVFRSLQANGIMPMPMLMHSDSQPLWSRDPPSVRRSRWAGPHQLDQVDDGSCDGGRRRH